MYPVILRIGDTPIITSFGLMMFMSFLTAAWMTGAQLRRYGLPKELAWDMLAWCAIGGVIGAKLYFLGLNWQQTLADPAGEVLRREGLVWYGGLIGGIIAYYLQVRSRRLPVATMYDATAPALAIAYAVGRIGCFLVGDDYGRYTDGRFGIAFPNGYPISTAGYLRSIGDQVPAQIPDAAVVAVHPTQLYETGLAVIMFAILWQLGTNRNLRVGQLFAAFMILYGMERFVIEFVRAKSDLLSFGGLTLSTSQLLSVLLSSAGVALWYRQNRARKTPLVSRVAAGSSPVPSPAL